MEPEFTGYWDYDCEHYPGVKEYLHISPEGRAVTLIVPTEPPKSIHYIGYPSWLAREEDRRYRSRPAPGHEGWLVTLSRVKNQLEITNCESNRVSRLLALDETDFPDNLKQTLSLTYSRMLDKESQQN